MMKRKVLVLIIAAIFYLPTSSFAWGAKGHQIIAEIAFHFLSDSTQKKVMKYLKNMSIEEAATWMDDMRSNDYYSFMSTWHFLNVEKGESYKPLAEHNVVTVLNAAIKDLENKQALSYKTINIDLLYIFHLVGDLHQPLHVGYGSDKGGNSVQVSFLSKSNTMNLHYVWDNAIIDTKNITADSCIELYKNYTPKQIDSIKNIDVLEWFKGSRSYVEGAYDFQNGMITQEYVDKNAEIIKQQLLFGGLRLASILEHLFNN
jgi:hypothetical protein